MAVHRAALVAVGLALAGGALFFLARPGPTVTPPYDAAAPEDEAAAGGPERLAPRAPVAPLPTSPRGASEAGDGTTGPAGDAPGERVFAGRVVDAETGAPVRGAVVHVSNSGTPCPRASEAIYDGGKLTSATTNASGEFAIRAPIPTADLFVSVPEGDYVRACACAVVAGSETTVRLVKGKAISGVVVDPKGRPVFRARVVAHEWPGSGAPGRDGETETDERGRFAIRGLLGDPLTVRASRGNYVSTEAGQAKDTTVGRDDLRLVLVPSLRATFSLSTDDLAEPKNPSVTWVTSGPDARQGASVLARAAQGTASAPDARPGSQDYGPVEVACDRASVSFEVKAVGYAAWRSAQVELPPEGGERAFVVELGRDPTLGRLRLDFEDGDRSPVSFAKERMSVAPWRRDGKDVAGGILYQPGDSLVFPALPAGAYGFLVRGARFAPAAFTADVAAGRDGEQRVTLGPPARLKVSFTAPERMVVRFRVTTGGEPATIYVERPAGAPAPEGPAAEGPDGTDTSAFPVGDGSVVLTGLGGGAHVVEVVSPDLTAPPTSVDLVVGDVREVEIAVRRR